MRFNKILTTIALLCAFAQGVGAQTVVMTENELLEAVRTDNANIQLGGDITIGKNIQITNSRTVTIDMNNHTLNRGLTARANNGQVFYVLSGSTLNLSNGTLTGGWGGDSGGLLNAGTANLTDVVISGNTGDNRGGGIVNRNGGTLNMTGGSIIGNTSKDIKVQNTDIVGGGGIFNYKDAKATLTGVTISGNKAEVWGGGGICNYGTLTIDGCTITNNTANFHGGGVWNGNDPSLFTVKNCTITGNNANRTGGGIFSYNNINIKGVNTITGNTGGNRSADNIYLTDSRIIICTGNLVGSNIGIDLERTPETFTDDFSGHNRGVDPTTIFTPDKPDINVVSLDPNGKEVMLQSMVADGSVYYIECSWDSESKKVVPTTKFLSTEIAFRATPTSADQYKVLKSSSDDGDDESEILNIGTKNCPYHEFYVVRGKVNLEKVFLKGPNVHIILCDGATFYPKGIGVLKGSTLYIHCQSSRANMGCLIMNEDDNFGIGGADWYDKSDRGGNIVIHGGDIDISNVKKFHAGIGGFYKEKNGNITIFGGEINTQGGINAAGIGGGQECEDFGTITIYDGIIQSFGGTYWMSNGGAGIGSGAGTGKGTVHILGGTIEATAGKDAAGIGGDEHSDYTGTVIIDGGHIVARGNLYGAGIGGGDRNDGGHITINGGYVEAYGGIDAAGIGGGEDGDGGTITITGGYVYAEGGWEYGAGIGGGQDGGGGNITITGGTVIAKAGQLGVTGMRGIGPGYGSSDYGKLTIGDGMMVRNWNCTEGPYPAALRRDYCWYRTQARLDPCTHMNITYTVSGAEKNDTHTAHCEYCTTQFKPELHTFEDGVCTVCGTHQSAETYIVNVYLPGEGGSSYGDPVVFNVKDGTTFNLPPAPNENIPINLEFAGWLEDAPPLMNNIETDGTETLLPAGTEQVINADAVFTARYRKIALTLADGEPNSETLSQYNGKQVQSIILRGRTLWKDGNWNTLCLPFALDNLTGTPLEGATLKELDVEGTYDNEQTGFDPTSSTLFLYFKDAEAIEAGKPYLVKWAGGDNIVDPVFGSVIIANVQADVVSEDGTVSFVGNYDPETLEDNDDSILYLGTDNMLYWPSTNLTINAFRGCFHLNLGKANRDEVRAFVMHFDDEGTQTGVVEIWSKMEEARGKMSDVWYDLSGRKFSKKPTQKGMYILNGVKQVIK